MAATIAANVDSGMRPPVRGEVSPFTIRLLSTPPTPAPPGAVAGTVRSPIMGPLMTVQDRAITDHDRSGTAQDGSDFVPVAEAARRLGISTATVKRRIAAGTLEAEQLTRPQGIEYRVRLPRDVTPPLSDVPPPLAERSASEAAPSTGTVQDLSAAIMAAVAPLEARLAVQDATIAQQAQTIERQAAEVADLREVRGRLSAELEQARARLAEVQVPAELGHVEELARENGTLAERLAGLERVRDAAMAHAAELEARLEAQAKPPEPEPAPDPFPAPIPPTPNAAPWWRRWVPWLTGTSILLVVVGSSCGQVGAVKHAELCTLARTSMDFWGRTLAAQPAMTAELWSHIRGAVDIAEKTC